MNAGISLAMERDAEYVWLLNNDTIVHDPAVLTKLLSNFDASSVGGVTPQVLEYPNTEQPWFTRGEVDWDSGHSIHHKTIPSTSEDTIQNDYIPFCSALIKTEVFKNYGLLPDEYFIYREDVAFAYLIRRDYQLLTDLRCSICHKSSNNTGGDLNRTLTYYTSRNRWLLYNEYADEMNLSRFLWQYMKWSLRQSVMIAKETKFNSMLALVQGTIDGILNKQGKRRYP
jgi:GT2 family glycosyltransferase